LKLIKWHLKNPQSKPIYLLCASAFTAADYKIFGMFKGKAYKWGYFPETKQYDCNDLMNKKDHKKILWCGRFLDWKHPDDIIKVAARLKNEGYEFALDIIGTGELGPLLNKMISENSLENKVNLLGAMKPELVRRHMEEAGIYVATSDFKEGWGAVINESMNSGCAVVASHAIGSVPFLLKDKENGIVYESGNIEDLYNKVKYLLDNLNKQEELGKAAYRTIAYEWNAVNATKRLCDLIEEIKNNGYSNKYKDGPCSKAEILLNDWY